MADVALWPVIFAAVANMIIGFIWYHPKVFGTAWMRMAGIAPDAAERGKARMPYMMLIALVGSLIVSYVLNWFGIAWGVYDWAGAVELGIWVWLGFVAPMMLGSVLWEQKPVKLYILNVGYWLVTLVVMSVILVM